MRLSFGSMVLLCVLSSGVTSSFAQCNACSDKRIISVTGTGRASADADLAIVRVGYKLYGADAKSVYATATDASNTIMNALTHSGIPKSAIESTSQVLQHTQQYEYQQYPVNSDEWRNRQFNAIQSWIVRVKPDEAAEALNTAVNAGANESGWIEWIVQNPGALQAQASSDAVAQARALAEQIAQKSNVRLGQLISATQNQGLNGFNGNMGGGVFADRMGTGLSLGIQYGNQPLAINSRRVEFTVSVSTVFDIE